MYYFILLIYIITFCVGSGAILLFLFIYLKFKSDLIRYYTIFVSLVLMLMMLGFYETYIHMIRVAFTSLTYTVFLCLNYVWGILIVRYFPLFVLKIIDIPVKKWLKTASVILMLMLILFPVLIIGAFHSDAGMNRLLLSWLEWLWAPIVSAVIFYCLFILIRYRKNILDPLKRKILKIIIILTVIFIPAFIVDILQPIIWNAVPWMPYGLKFSTFYFIIWNLISFYIVPVFLSPL